MPRILQVILAINNLFPINGILPGYNRIRGLLLYELQAAVCTLSKIRFAGGDIPLEKHLEELMVIVIIYLS